MSIHRTSAQPVKMERLTIVFLRLLLLYTHACCDPEVCFDFIYSLVIFHCVVVGFFCFFLADSDCLFIICLVFCRTDR